MRVLSSKGAPHKPGARLWPVGADGLGGLYVAAVSGSNAVCFFFLLIGRFEYRFTLAEPELQLTGVIGIGLDRQLYIDGLEGHLPLPKAACSVDPRWSLPF